MKGMVRADAVIFCKKPRRVFIRIIVLDYKKQGLVAKCTNFSALSFTFLYAEKRCQRAFRRLSKKGATSSARIAWSPMEGWPEHPWPCGSKEKSDTG
jgi:hypothetical protein